MSGKGLNCVTCSGRLAVFWDHFGRRTDVISGRYPVPRHLTLNLTLKVKCQVKGHGYVSFSRRIANFFRPFW